MSRRSIIRTKSMARESLNGQYVLLNGWLSVKCAHLINGNDGVAALDPERFEQRIDLYEKWVTIMIMATSQLMVYEPWCYIRPITAHLMIILDRIQFINQKLLIHETPSRSLHYRYVTIRWRSNDGVSSTASTGSRGGQGGNSESYCISERQVSVASTT